MRAKATIIAMTRRTAVVQVEVTNDGRLACLAQGTVLIPDAPKTS
jgi:acyl-coenzyme A thioesterase PaaI-like protein